MSPQEAIRIGRAPYVSWRATTLGAVKEAIEAHLILALASHLRGRYVLDVGCGDGVLACAMAARGAKATGIAAFIALAAERPRER